MERERPEDSPIPQASSVEVTGDPPRAEKEKETAHESAAQTAPQLVTPLSLVDVLMILAVLEDTTDQLSILSYIMPIQYERKQSGSLKTGSPEKAARLSTARQIPAPVPFKEGTPSPEAKGRGQELRPKTPRRLTLMTLESLKKMQSDRQFFSDVTDRAMQELLDSGTFSSLLQTLSEEREKNTRFCDIIAREEEGRRKIKSLQKQLISVKKERQAEEQSRNEYIAHLRDQLQEMKAKANMENQYMKQNAELQIAQTQNKCSKTEEQLLEEIEKLRMRTEEENRIHMEIEVFLRKEQQKLEEKLEFWMEKFDKDTETKQNELNALQAAKASDLARLQELAKTIREYEQVIMEDRLEKEKARKKMEQDILELKSAIKIQAWWRGTVVRKEIGGFRMPMEKSDSKDAKGKEKGRRRGKK